MEERPLVNRLGGEVIASFNYRARFLPSGPIYASGPSNAS